VTSSESHGPVVVVAVLRPNPQHIEQALSGVMTAVPGILAEDGCELYAPHLADDGTIVIVERWASRADLDAHTTGVAVEVLRSGVKGLMASPPVVTSMAPVETVLEGARL
jgi:quinol monooxygenase YgiN